MKGVGDKKKRGFTYYFLRLPLIICIGLINAMLISWFVYLIYQIFSDSSANMSLIEWIEYLISFLS